MSPPFILSEQGSHDIYNDSNANTTNQDLNVIETASPLSKRLTQKSDASKINLAKAKEADSERIYRVYLNPVCSYINQRNLSSKTKKQNFSRNNSNIAKLINSEISNSDIIDRSGKLNSKGTKISRSIKELLKIKSKSNLKSQRLDHILNGTNMAIHNLGSRFKMSGRHMKINFIRSTLISKEKQQEAEAEAEDEDLNMSKEFSNVKLNFLDYIKMKRRRKFD